MSFHIVHWVQTPAYGSQFGRSLLEGHCFGGSKWVKDVKVLSLRQTLKNTENGKRTHPHRTDPSLGRQVLIDVKTKMFFRFGVHFQWKHLEKTKHVSAASLGGYV